MARAYIASALLIAFCMGSVSGPVFGQRRQTQQYIRISKETTWLTEPVTSDGYVDYSAAINAINVVPQEDNAAATLIELAGVPKYWEQSQRDKLRGSLGLSALPECGDSLKSEYDFTHDLEDAGLPIPDDENRFEQGVLASSQPWTAVEAPFIDRWIEANSKHLAKVDVILAKSGYFEPMIPCRQRTPTIVPASCDIAKHARWKITELLVSRCFRHLGEQRFEEAIHDLVRIHKLARLGQKGKLVFGLVDNTHLERHALVVGEKMLEATDLDRDSLIAYLKAIQQLEPLAKAKDLCHYHRLFHLASTTLCARKSPQAFVGDVRAVVGVANDLVSEAGVEDLSVEQEAVPYCCRVTSDQIEWDYLLRNINQRYDRAEQIHRMPGTVKRLQAIRDLVKETQQRTFHFADHSQFDTVREQSEIQARRQLTDDIDVVLDELLNVEHYSTYEELSLRAQLDLLRIMTAVRLHEKLHGALPKTFDAIKDYFGEQLVDPFSEKPYRCEPVANGLEISSASNDDEELPRAFRELKVTVKSRYN